MNQIQTIRSGRASNRPAAKGQCIITFAFTLLEVRAVIIRFLHFSLFISRIKYIFSCGFLDESQMFPNLRQGSVLTTPS